MDGFQNIYNPLGPVKKATQSPTILETALEISFNATRAHP